MPEDEDKSRELLKEALELIINLKPMPSKLLEGLDPATVRKLLELVERLRRQGLVGRDHSPGERLRALREMLAERPDEQDPVEEMSEPARTRQRATEAVELRRDEALERRRLKGATD